MGASKNCAVIIFSDTYILLYLKIFHLKLLTVCCQVISDKIKTINEICPGNSGRGNEKSENSNHSRNFSIPGNGNGFFKSREYNFFFLYAPISIFKQLNIFYKYLYFCYFENGNFPVMGNSKDRTVLFFENSGRSLKFISMLRWFSF